MVSVKYSGPWAEGSGYAQANRNIIQSLYESGVDVVTELQRYANHPTDYGYQYKIAKSLENKHEKYPIKVLHITPNVYRKHKEVGKFHIGHLFWETTGMAKDWAWYMREVDEIWTGCTYNETCFRKHKFSGNIFKFPQPIDVDRVGRRIPINDKQRRRNAREFVFYSIFQWIERKDPKSLLTAYWQEFRPEENVSLVLKTYRLGLEDHEKQQIYNDIKKWKNELGLQAYPHTMIIDELLSDQDMHDFHESGDCFVSAHRGEGWAIPQCEALVHGKPVISTNLGGMHEWVPDSGMYKTSFTMEKVHDMDWAEQYTSDQEWAKVDIDDLRKKMRYVFENREEAKKTAEIGRKYVRENFNFKAVGELMKNRLSEIYQEQEFKE